MAGLDFPNHTIIGTAPAAQFLRFKTGSQDAFVIDNNFRTYYPNQVGFMAGKSTDIGWVAIAPANAWSPQTWYDNVIYNKGGGFLSSRFTAPVAGTYLFHWVAYHYKPSAVAGHVIYPAIFINGGFNQILRIIGYPQAAGYAFDTEITELVYMNAGDYADVQLQPNAVGISIYPAYASFIGVLVG
jgi:hypothetical protein